MTLSTISKHTKALLLGNGAFPKDATLEPITQVKGNIEGLASSLTKGDGVGMEAVAIKRLLNIKDNTKIKEEIASVSESAKEVFILHISGYAIHRKGHIYLASSGSTKGKIHLNGIAFDEIIDILGDSEALAKIVFLDVCFLDSQEESIPQEEISGLLEAYIKNDHQICLISTTPEMGLQAFLGYTQQTIFTQSLVEVLRKGVPVEKDELTLADVQKGMQDYLAEQGLHNVPMGSHELQSEVIFAKNSRFNLFKELKAEADASFQKEAYEEALKIYKQASELMPDNAEVSAKRKFIRLLLKGIELQEQYPQQAKNAFIDAHKLIDLPIIRNKIIDVLLMIGERQLKLEKFEPAKEQYKEVLDWDPNHELAKERLDECITEVSFLDYMEEADRLYFDDEFEQALNLYDKALEIHTDRKAQRRKAECDRLIRKEAQLRDRLTSEIQAAQKEEVDKDADEKQEQELRQEIEAMLRPQIQEELQQEITERLENEISDRLGAQLKEKLAAQQASLEERFQKEKEQLEKALNKKANQNFEEDFWTNALLENRIDVYRFYLQFFPRPRYAEKAKSRIRDLKKQQQANKTEQLNAIDFSVNHTKEERAESDSSIDTGKHPKNGVKHPSRSESPQEIISRLEATFNGKEHKVENKNTEKDQAEEEKESTPIKENDANDTEELLAKAIQEEMLGKVDEEEPTPPVDIAYTEEDLWEKATSENSLEGYHFYVENTTESKHLVDAYYQINQLVKSAKLTEAADENDDEVEEEIVSKQAEIEVVEEETEIEEPLQEESSEETEEVEAEQVKGEHEEVAVPHIEKQGAEEERYEAEAEEQEEEEVKPASYDEQSLWNRTHRENTLDAYYDYISQSKDKYFLEEAKQQINLLKSAVKQTEVSDWESARDANTVEALKGYIRKYPLGDFYAKAMFQISELEAQNS